MVNADVGVWVVTEEEPEHREYPSVVVGVFSSEELADEFVTAHHVSEYGVKPEDDDEERDRTWEKHRYSLDPPLPVMKSRAQMAAEIKEALDATHEEKP